MYTNKATTISIFVVSNKRIVIMHTGTISTTFLLIPSIMLCTGFKFDQICSMLKLKWGFNFSPSSHPLIHWRMISQFRPPLKALSDSACSWRLSPILKHSTRATNRRRNGPREHSMKWDTLAQWLSCHPIAVITRANGLLATSSWCVRCGMEMRQSGKKRWFSRMLTIYWDWATCEHLKGSRRKFNDASVMENYLQEPDWSVLVLLASLEYVQACSSWNMNFLCTHNMHTHKSRFQNQIIKIDCA